MFLDDDDDPVVGRISRRLSEVTGLSMATAEQLQIANYGLGGHYAPHFDMTINENTLVKLTTDQSLGNRIATGLFYVNNSYDVAVFYTFDLLEKGRRSKINEKYWEEIICQNKHAVLNFSYLRLV